MEELLNNGAPELLTETAEGGSRQFKCLHAACRPVLRLGPAIVVAGEIRMHQRHESLSLDGALIRQREHLLRCRTWFARRWPTQLGSELDFEASGLRSEIVPRWETCWTRRN